MKTFAFLVAALAAAGVARAEAESDGPVVSSLDVTQNAATRRVTVTYDLSVADAVVSFAVWTNTLADAQGDWVKLPEPRTAETVGDVFRIVPTGTGRTFHWLPDIRFGAVDLGAVRVTVTAFPTNAAPTYMACNILTGERRYFADEASLPGGIQSDAYRTAWLLLRRIPAKDVVWTMGTDRLGYEADWEYPHAVMFTADFYMAVFEITQWQWAAVQGSRPFRHPDDAGLRPFEGKIPGSDIWGDQTAWPTNAQGEVIYAMGADTVIGRLRTRTRLGNRLFLPTEAQWEFACRAGTDADFNDGGNLGAADEATNAHLDELGRYKGNGTGTARVGSYRPNAWGLYDMHGNVSEWCADRAGVSDALKIPSAWKTGETLVDPRGYSDGDVGGDRFRHFARGGNWNSTPRACRSTSRSLNYQIWQEACEPYCGLRLIYQLDRETVDAPVSETSVELTSLASAVRSSATGETGAFDSRFASSAASEGAIELLTDPLGLMMIVR